MDATHELYRPLIETSDAIWAGDFNAGFALDWTSSRYKFRDCVSLLGGRGLRSQLDCRCPCGLGAAERSYAADL
jgi:hypothetical protein